MKVNINSNFKVDVSEDSVLVIPKDESKKDPIWGTTRSLVANVS